MQMHQYFRDHKGITVNEIKVLRVHLCISLKVDEYVILKILDLPVSTVFCVGFRFHHFFILNCYSHFVVMIVSVPHISAYPVFSEKVAQCISLCWGIYIGGGFGKRILCNY